MLYAKIALKGFGTYIQPLSELGVLLEEIKAGEVGDNWSVQLVEMPEEEYADLPEFTGH